MNPLRRRTTCPVPGHGARCEAAAGKDQRWPRVTENRIALRFEQDADGEEHEGPAWTEMITTPRYGGA